MRSAAKGFKFDCPCGTMGVNESHIQELKLVCCMQCGHYGHRKCNGIRNDHEAATFLCKGCVRNMNKQVVSGGLTMDVLGPFYPEGDSAKLCSWTSAKVGYFIHTIGGARATPRKAARRANAYLEQEASEAKAAEAEREARSPSARTEVCGACPAPKDEPEAQSLLPAATIKGEDKGEDKRDEKRDVLVPIHSNGSASDGEVAAKQELGSATWGAAAEADEC